VVATVGWFAMNKNEDKNTTQTESKTSYTDTASIYSLKYPSSWSLNEEDPCCEGEPKDPTQFSQSITIVPADKTSIFGYGVKVQADKTDALAKEIEKNWSDNNQQPEAVMINGYDAKYVKREFKGDAENYIDHSYLLTHNGATVYLTYRENYYHQYPAADWSAAEDMDEFSAILNSVTFLN
jgi:hypothetical protein